MADQQTAQPAVVPGMHPVVHGFVAHLEFKRRFMDPSAAVEQQQPQTTGTKVCMRVVARQLLQGLLLRFAQFNNAFHGQVIGLARPSDTAS
jgi:hypothetical protein